MSCYIGHWVPKRHIFTRISNCLHTMLQDVITHPSQETSIWHTYMYTDGTVQTKILWGDTVWCFNNMGNVLQNTHNRYPISHPWGRDKGCFLWIQSQVHDLLWSKHCCIQYWGIFDSITMTPDCGDHELGITKMITELSSYPGYLWQPHWKLMQSNIAKGCTVKLKLMIIITHFNIQM